MAIAFRAAEKKDVPLIYEFIYALADYHDMRGELSVTEEMLEEWIFEKEKAYVRFLLLEGKEIGAAIYFFNYSTVTGRGGLYLEDLYIRPQYRGRGFGKAVLQELARIALEKGCARMDWMCLDENTSGMHFYKMLGAEQMKGWSAFYLAGEALLHLANPPQETTSTEKIC